MKNLFYIISIIFIGACLFSNTKLIQAGSRMKVQKENYADLLNFKGRFLDPQEWVGDEAEALKLKRAAEIQDKVVIYKNKSKTYFWIILGLNIVFLAFVFFVYSLYKKYIVLGLLISALMCLHVGLMYPMLEIMAFERDLDIGELPIKTNVMGFNVDLKVSQKFDGDMVFYYQSKSVVELVQVLFQQKNWIVAIAIMAFSILFPLLKLFGTIGILYSDAIKNSKFVNFFVKHAGKWSMADVFVVSVFLAFLAFSNMQVGIKTESNILLGLYFFLAYCVLSMLSSSYLGERPVRS